VYSKLKVQDMFKSKEKMMGLEVKNRLLLNTMRGYTARQLQFAIRLGILPTPDKLNRILSRKSGSENEIKLLLRNLQSMKA
jgi:hypothetical protein